MPNAILVGDFGGYGHAQCPTCAGAGHLIGTATTTAAHCPTCHGRGYVQWGQWPRYATKEEIESAKAVIR